MMHPNGSVELAEGFRLRRDEQGRIRISAEAWSPPLDSVHIQERVAARLAECRAALELTERNLAHPGIAKQAQDELLDRYSTLLRERRLLEDYLLVGE